MAKVFRIAYLIAKSRLSFQMHNDLIELQEINVLDIGKCLFSKVTCAKIINFIAAEMKKTLVHHLSMFPVFYNVR